MLEPAAQEAALDPAEALLVQAVFRQEFCLIENAVSDLLGVQGVAAAGQYGGAGAELLAAAEAGIDEAVLIQPLVQLAGLAEEHLGGDACHQLLVGHSLARGGRGALEGQLEGGHGHVHLPAGQGGDGLSRLRFTEIGDGHAGFLLRQDLLGDGGHLLGVHIAHHAQHHIGRVVEGPVAVVEGLGGDLLDGFHGTRNGDPDGVVMIESLVHLLHDHGIGGVGVHQNLLGDDAPLLLHALLGEPGGGHEFQQQPQGGRKIVGAGKIIGGDAVGGEGVGAGTQGGEFLGDVPARQVEHLVLEIVGHAGGGGVVLAVQGEGGVDGAVVGHKIGDLPAEAGLGDHQHRQTVGQDLPAEGFVQAGVVCLLHFASPFRKNTVWSFTPAAHRATSAAVTARMASI